MVCLFGNRMTVIHGGSNIPHPFSISLFEGQLFFTDWTKMAVLKANKFKETNPRLYYRSSLRPFGVTVYHALRQPDGRRPPTVENPAWYSPWQKGFLKVLMRFGWCFQMFDGLSRELNQLKLALQVMGILEKLMYFSLQS